MAIAQLNTLYRYKVCTPQLAILYHNMTLIIIISTVHMNFNNYCTFLSFPIGSQRRTAPHRPVLLPTPERTRLQVLPVLLPAHLHVNCCVLFLLRRHFRLRLRSVGLIFFIRGSDGELVYGTEREGKRVVVVVESVRERVCVIYNVSINLSISYQHFKRTIMMNNL